jgi:uroporphyrinogen-III synthase
VGEITAETARRAGFAARSADGDVAALADLVAEGHRPGGAVLHLRGRHAAGDLVAELAARGIPARAAEIYDQRPCPLAPEARDLLARGDRAVLPVFSPRTARLFAAEAADAGWDLGAATAVSLGAAADAALAAAGVGTRRVAERPTREAMLAALAAL